VPIYSNPQGTVESAFNVSHNGSQDSDLHTSHGTHPPLPAVPLRHSHLPPVSSLVTRRLRPPIALSTCIAPRHALCCEPQAVLEHLGHDEE
jgi:hypothetical protein